MTDPAQQDVARIVVGVDGSAYSRAALRWAITQARLTGARIEAVAAWQDPSMGYSLGWHAAPYTDQNLAVIARKGLDHTIDELTTELDLPVQISARVEEGHPAFVLPEVARGAQLLVLGSRGHGAFAGMVLGSVSQHCVQHMTCPVVVIPPSETPSAAPR